MLHGHLQTLQVVVLDNKSQNGPLEVPFSFTEGAMGWDQARKLWRRMSQQGRAHLWITDSQSVTNLHQKFTVQPQDQSIFSLTCIPTVNPAPGNSFNAGWRGWVLFVVLWGNDGVRPLKYRTLGCVTVCDWTGLKTNRETTKKHRGTRLNQELKISIKILEHVHCLYLGGNNKKYAQLIQDHHG